MNYTESVGTPTTTRFKFRLNIVGLPESPQPLHTPGRRRWSSVATDSFGGCGIQDPYDLSSSAGRLQPRLTHIFSGSFVVPLPFGGGRKFSTSSSLVNHIIGNWQLNGIVALNSGPPYDVQTDNTIANTNNFYGLNAPIWLEIPMRAATRLSL